MHLMDEPLSLMFAAVVGYVVVRTYYRTIKYLSTHRYSDDRERWRT